MDSLENEKDKILAYIREIEITLTNNKLDETLIEKYLIKDISNLHKNKRANDQKPIISTYVESVIVFDDRVEINLVISFVYMIGGGEVLLSANLTYRIDTT